MRPQIRNVAVVFLSSMLGAAPAVAATLTSAPFGTTQSGKPVTRYTMATVAGVSVSFMSYGGAITDVTTPDRQGRPGHVVLGFPTLRQYETTGADDELYFGALLGRYTNWIARGRFTLDGRRYQLTLSDPPNTIHGGKTGFDKRVWDVQSQATSGESVGALLSYVSPDGEEGYPGTLKVGVTYTLSDDGTFAIRYRATTDKDTILNLSEPYELQPGWRRVARRHPRAHPHRGCGSLHAARPDAAPPRIPDSRRRDAVRLPQADRDRRAHP